jgi:hypothetical protein
MQFYPVSRFTMNADENDGHRILENLSRAVEIWVGQSNGEKLTRWLTRELDAEGGPIRLKIAELHACIEILAGSRRNGESWPKEVDPRVAGLILTALRFARPDGGPSMSFDDLTADPSRTWKSADWAGWYRGTGIGRILGWWFDPKTKEQAPPPLPAWSAPDRVLAILRADWQATGDFLAVDHRDARSHCRFELFGGGRPWLGPGWSGPDAGGPTSGPKPRSWITGSVADFAEWSYRAGRTRVTRSALLLRGRSMAMLSVLVEGTEASSGSGWTMRLSLPPTISATPLEGSRALVLAEPKRRGSAQVLPIGLPSLPYTTDRGRFHCDDRDLALTQAPGGRRCWLPLLVSWDSTRHRKPVNWRILTVSERSRAVSADRAFAARVSWGRDETYVIYRSLGPPAPRAFLGFQTRARFLVAQFTPDGSVKPILAID